MVIVRKFLKVIWFFKITLITLVTCLALGSFVLFQRQQSQYEKSGERDVASEKGAQKNNIFNFSNDKGLAVSTFSFIYNNRKFRFNFAGEKFEIYNSAKEKWSMVSVDFNYASMAFAFTNGKLVSISPTDKKFIGELGPVKGKTFSVGVNDAAAAKKFWAHIETLKLQDFFSMVPDPSAPQEAPTSPVTQAF